MRRPDHIHILVMVAFIISSFLVIAVAAFWGTRLLVSRQNQPIAQPTDLGIAGFPMSGNPAPDFRLTDQFGHVVTLSSLRGQEIVLAFIDSRCTSICPLTAKIMYDAKAELGTAASTKVALVAINANPSATSVTAVQDWSINHGMLHQWLFLTGSAEQLQAVYRSYQIYDQVGSNGQVIHDPAMLIIDAQGHERLYFETLDSNNPDDIQSQEIGLVAGMRQWLPAS